MLLQNSRKSERNGKPARRRKRLSARLLKSVSVLLLPRPPRRTRWKPPVHLIPHRLLVVNPLLILAVSALNFPRSGTSPLTARCMADTVQRVVWCTRAMARWPTLPTILTPLTHKVVKCINHVSNALVMLFFVLFLPELGNHVKEKQEKRLQRIRLWGFLSCYFPIRFQVGFSADR